MKRMHNRTPVMSLLTCLCSAVLTGSGCASTYIWAIQSASLMEWYGQDRVELPLILDSLGRPATNVEISGNTFLALLDSGSPVPTIRTKAVESLGLKVERDVRDLTVQLGTGRILLATAFVGHDSGNTQLTLGQELFSQAVVEMDFDTRRLTLIRPEAFVAPGASAIPVVRRKSRPSVQISVSGFEQSICAIVDTGFDSGIALSPKLAAQLSLPVDTGKPKVVYSGFSGKRVEADALLPLPLVRMGGQPVSDVPVVGIVPNDNDNCSSLVGMRLLSRYRLIFDMANSRIWLLPRVGMQ